MPRSPALRAIKRALQQSLHPSGSHDPRGTDPERRRFLKATLYGTAATVPLAGVFGSCASASKGHLDPTALPVAVVGGGLAGLTAAYRLSQAGIRCELFEAQSRLGGRVFTKDRFNAEGMFCELGGELIDSKHAAMLGLAFELGVPVDDFRPFDAKVKRHQFFFGGRRYYDDELTAAAGPLAARLLADMTAAFKDVNSPEVSYRDFTPEAARLDRLSVAEYLDGIRDLEPWVRDSISIAYLTEYGLDPGEQSSINLMMLLDPVIQHGFGIFGESDEAMRVRGGNSRLVEALAKAVESRARIRLEHRLAKIEDKGSSVELTFATGGTSRTVRVGRVISTVPFTVLRDVEGLDALSPLKRRCIAELGYGQNTKRMVGYKSRRWRERHGGIAPSSGYTFTDLPSQTLWESSRVQKGRSGIITAFLGGSAAVDPSRASVESVLSDMEAICPGTRALHDGNEILMRWPAQPFFKGSYACPRVGQYTTLMGSAKEPELDGKLLFAGENVSEEYQGYMNGAVETADAAAKTIISEAGARPAASVWRAVAPVEA